MGRGISEFWVMVFYCALIFAAGLIFGFIFTGNAQVGLLAVLGALASLSTIGAAIVAVRALRGWKEQFTFQKKYESVIHLRTFLHSAAEPHAYLTELRDHLASYIRTGDSNDLADPDKYPFETQKKWFAHFSDISRAWDMMNVFLTAEEISAFKFSPEDVEAAVDAASTKMTETAFSDMKNSILHLHEATSVGVKEIAAAYKSLELQTRDFLKEISS